MSLSRPQEIVESPIEVRFGTNKKLGKLYRVIPHEESDKGYEDAPLPFRFILLDDSWDKIVGRDNENRRVGSGYFHSDLPVRFRRYFNNGKSEVIAEGNMKDPAFENLVKSKANGGQRAKCLLIFTEDGKIGQFTLSGNAYSAWVDAKNKIPFKQRQDNPYWVIKEMQEKESPYSHDASRVPLFELDAKSPLEKVIDEAIKADKILQEYMDWYTDKITSGSNDASDQDYPETEDDASSEGSGAGNPETTGHFVVDAFVARMKAYEFPEELLSDWETTMQLINDAGLPINEEADLISSFETRLDQLLEKDGRRAGSFTLFADGSYKRN